MQFHISPGPTGSGKTRSATNWCCDRIPRGVKTAIVQPTIKLCKQSRAGARHRFPAIKNQITCIVSQAGAEQKVARRVTDFLKDRDKSGHLLYLTHAGFLRVEYWHRPTDWHIFLDEAMDISYFRQFRLKDHPHLLTGLFTVRPFSEKYSVLEARDHGLLQMMLEQLADDEIYEHFADLTSRLISPHWNIYVGNENWRKFELGEAHRLDMHGMMHPSFFEQFASTTLMAANLSDTIMYKY